MPFKPELLSPAGSFDAALAAFQFGADAVYLGLPQFSARADADNLTVERLRVLLAYARTFQPRKKIYVTFNTLVKQSEMRDAVKALEALADLPPDGVIVQDLGVATLIRKYYPTLPLHASTQLAAHNLDGVKALRDRGFVRVVLARELTLDEIADIVQNGGTEIEIFIHGALCYSVSGLCLFSSHSTGRSGNRGRCAYCCRERFRCAGFPDGVYPFSMKDLALGPIMDRVVATGAHSLKIEGRMKNPHYVACVTDYYRKLLDHSMSDSETMVQDLQTVFSRPWTKLYAEGKDVPPDEIIDPIGIGHRGARIGEVENVCRDRDGTRWLRFTTRRALEKHDGIQVELPSGGKPFGFAVNAMRESGKRNQRPISLPVGKSVELLLPADSPTLPVGSPVFCSASQAVRRNYEFDSVRESELPIGKNENVLVILSPETIEVRSESGTKISLPCQLIPANNPDKTAVAVRKAFSRTGGSGWTLGDLKLDDPLRLYAPPSLLNEARRIFSAQLAQDTSSTHQLHIDKVLDESQKSGRDHSVSEAAAATYKFRVEQWVKKRFDIPVVLDIGHRTAAETLEHLERWLQQTADRPILALPLITRAWESDPLDRTVAELIRRGYGRWECADLSGLHRLRRLGVHSVDADWSYYAFNRLALGSLDECGVGNLVLSPEHDKESLLPLLSDGRTAALVYQHTPLFISETPPLLPGNRAPDSPTRFTNRNGETFVAYRRDSRWVTVNAKPYMPTAEILNLAKRRRYDFSWDPETEPDLSAAINGDGVRGNLNRNLL
ncbi:MAG: U32 family peptidase [Kiritimatiellae bacterium]|nr:U32 family peptidase [Kiritimatiellia bacterium]